MNKFLHPLGVACICFLFISPLFIVLYFMMFALGEPYALQNVLAMAGFGFLYTLVSCYWDEYK